MVAGFREKKARLWDVASGTLLGLLEHRGPVVATAFSSDGKTILTASEDGTVRLWDADWRPPAGHALDLPTSDQCLEISPDLRVAATGRVGVQGRYQRLWNVFAGKPIAPEIRSSRAGTTWVDFSPDSKTYLILTDRLIRLWDTATGLAKGPAHEQSEAIEQPAFSPDSRSILIGSGSGTAWIWDVSTARVRGKIPVQRGSVDAVGWSPDCRTFATGLDIAEVQVWDAATLTPLGKPIPHPGAVGCILFSPDGKSILISGEDGTARLWDIARREPCIPPLVHEGGYIRDLAFSADGETIATGGAG